MSVDGEVSGPPDTRFLSLGHVAETGSTNADLLGAARAGAPEGTVLVADHQLAGRGRQSRRFYGEPGSSLLISALLRPSIAIAPYLPFVAGLAVVDAVSELGAPGAVALKWPNDVLAPGLDERKLAGILVEATTAGSDGGSVGAVVGIGLNLRWFESPPDDVAARAATLRQLGVDEARCERWMVANELLVQLDRWYSEVIESPLEVMARYRECCLTLGRTVRLATTTGEIEGLAVGITADGALELETPSGRHLATAGDAHHIAATGSGGAGAR